MSQYYPYGVFCNFYGMWCDDVVELTEGTNECNGDCNNCERGEQVTK